MAEETYTVDVKDEGAEKAVLQPAMSGRDMFGRGRTGTWKTLAFGIPILDKIIKHKAQHGEQSDPLALVLAPTTELAKQVSKEFTESAPKLKTLCLYGEDIIELQWRELYLGCDAVVGTPGRIIDLITRGALNLSSVQFVVLDEADQMLAVGFEEDVEMILDKLPKKRQSMMFSATMPPWILKLSQKYLNNPLVVDLVAIARRLSDAHTGVRNQEDASTTEKSKSSSEKSKSSNSKNEGSLLPEKSIHASPRITVHDRRWTDGSVPLDAVSANLARLGKDALKRRVLASTAAVEALEEAAANESIYRNLSMFTDLCSTSKAANPLTTIDKFLSLYEIAVKSVAVVESLASSRSSDRGEHSFRTERSKSISLWIEAALATDLEVITLLNDQTVTSPQVQSIEKHATDSVDPIFQSPPRTSGSKRQPLGANRSKDQLPTSDYAAGSWSSGNTIKETLELSRNLKSEMQMWFLRFVEESLDAGFKVFGVTHRERGPVAAVLSNLKRINNWLDRVGEKRDELLTEKIKKVKRKVDWFVMRLELLSFVSGLKMDEIVGGKRVTKI